MCTLLRGYFVLFVQRCVRFVRERLNISPISLHGFGVFHTFALAFGQVIRGGALMSEKKAE